jgi:hypothetical protein
MYVRPEEVRKNLVKAGFELWEKNGSELSSKTKI